MSETDNNYYIAKKQGSYNFLVSDGKILLTAVGEAFAIYSADDQSLTFYCGIAPKEGTSYKGKTATDVYTGFEKELESGAVTTPPWCTSRRTSIRTAVIDSSFKNVRPTILAYWFYNLTNLTEITGGEYLDTSGSKNTAYMFYNCSSLTSLDTSKWDMSNMTSISYMFYNCSSLTNLDVSGWNTKNMTSTLFAFYNCSSLTSLDVSKWNMGNATLMRYMFDGCSSLTSLDVSGWNTENVVDMGSMFANCSSLTNLDVSKFNTKNMTDIWGMFDGCSRLTSIDVSGWNTESVTSMFHMFRKCRRLTTIYSNDDNFVTTAVTSGNDMFTDCDYLVGGNGTVYSSDNVTYTMAHVDTTSNPGYFTSKSS